MAAAKASRSTTSSSGWIPIDHCGNPTADVTPLTTVVTRSSNS